jgi:hypothetical protein
MALRRLTPLAPAAAAGVATTLNSNATRIDDRLSDLVVPKSSCSVPRKL